MTVTADQSSLFFCMCVAAEGIYLTDPSDLVTACAARVVLPVVCGHVLFYGLLYFYFFGCRGPKGRPPLLLLFAAAPNLLIDL
jgi:hypothetical protein